MTDGIHLTVCRGSGDWEEIYVDGGSVYGNHLDRSWPDRILDIIEGETVVSTNRISDEDMFEHVDPDELATDPEGTVIWEYPDEIPSELWGDET